MNSNPDIMKILNLLNYSPRKALRSRDDPFFQEGNKKFPDNKVMVFYKDEEKFLKTSEPKIKCYIETCRETFSSTRAYEHHCDSVHKNVCADCHLIFPSSHLVDIHILEKHDSLFQIKSKKEKMYCCLAEICTEKFWSPVDRKKHLIKIHKYPSNYRFDRFGKTKIKNNSSLSGMEIDTEDPSTTEKAKSGPTRKYVCSVPKTISFGQGTPRGFPSGRKNSENKKKSSKDWHQHHKDEHEETRTDIEKMDFNDLQKTLEG